MLNINELKSIFTSIITLLGLLVGLIRSSYTVEIRIQVVPYRSRGRRCGDWWYLRNFI